ncbi:MAG: ECF-type sigma factor [Pirellulaceae bacterium]|nr:ECF-type sigma factor [Pirellulaceae bacterium]
MANSITSWLNALRRGDSEAARNLWGHYFKRVLRLARRNLAGRNRATVVDEEDVAVGVLGELFVKLREGGYRDLGNRDELWQRLVVITIRQAALVARRENTQKRGRGRVTLESELTASGPFRLDDLIGHDLSDTLPEMMSQQCRVLIDALQDPELEQIALWKLAGHTNDEIADKLDCTRATIQRKLRLIRKIWDVETEGLASGGEPEEAD